MCTLIVLHRCFADAELLVAANRDEYLDRPAEPPALRRWNGRTVLAPRDVRAGGTWLGLNDAGVFAALTNRPNATPDPTRRSRGLLVVDALAASRRGSGCGCSWPTCLRARTTRSTCSSATRDAAFVVVYEDKADVRRARARAPT